MGQGVFIPGLNPISAEGIAKEKQADGLFENVVHEPGGKRGGKRRRVRNSAGRFELRSMAPGVYTVRVVPPGYLPAEVEGIEVVAGRVISVSTPPKLGADAGNSNLQINRSAAATPPLNSKLSTPPAPANNRCARSYCGWLSRPG